VQHHLVDALLALRFAAPLVYRAAWSLDDGHPQRSVHVSMAKIYASEAARLACRKSLQVHGAIGYTLEFDLQLWMKRIWSLSSAWGDPAWHRDRAARFVLGETHA
jgi:alkylation response protein AidB-like acyl-CoA dehydrogenase